MIAEEIVRLQPKDYREEEFLNVKDLSVKLGISESTIQHMKNLPRVNIGKVVRYPLNQVINFLTRKRR
jgi:hypothetical protein